MMGHDDRLRAFVRLCGTHFPTSEAPHFSLAIDRINRQLS